MLVTELLIALRRPILRHLYDLPANKYVQETYQEHTRQHRGPVCVPLNPNTALTRVSSTSRPIPGHTVRIRTSPSACAWLMTGMMIDPPVTTMPTASGAPQRRDNRKASPRLAPTARVSKTDQSMVSLRRDEVITLHRAPWREGTHSAGQCRPADIQSTFSILRCARKLGEKEQTAFSPEKRDHGGSMKRCK